MIKVEFANYDIDEDFQDLFPNVCFEIAGEVDHAAYMAVLFRRFMLAVGYSKETIDKYIVDIDDIRGHIEDSFNHMLDEDDEEFEDDESVFDFSGFFNDLRKVEINAEHEEIVTMLLEKHIQKKNSNGAE